jgi:hypothetical protein
MTYAQGQKLKKRFYLRHLLARASFIIPHFSLSPQPDKERGGIEEQTGVDPVKQKKMKKRTSEAWKKIQQRNYAFSGDPHILQSHENNFIPIQKAEQEEPAKLFLSFEEEEKKENNK